MFLILLETPFVWIVSAFAASGNVEGDVNTAVNNPSNNVENSANANQGICTYPPDDAVAFLFLGQY
jgi:hypothetical protein